MFVETAGESREAMCWIIGQLLGLSIVVCETGSGRDLETLRIPENVRVSNFQWLFEVRGNEKYTSNERNTCLTFLLDPETSFNSVATFRRSKWSPFVPVQDCRHLIIDLPECFVFPGVFQIYSEHCGHVNGRPELSQWI